MTEETGELLLVAADWRSRALLLAELQEAGFPVRAAPGIQWAITWLLRGQVTAPALLVVDVHQDPLALPNQVTALQQLSGGAPLVLIVGVYQRRAFESLRASCAAFLVRPVTIGQVVAVVRRLWPALPSSH